MTIADALGDSILSCNLQPWLLLAAVALGGCGTDGDGVGVNQPLSSIPVEYRGSWKMVQIDGSLLPSPYPDYEIEIVDNPSKCAVYKSKGVSRLPMFEGATATATSEAESLALIFAIDDGRRFELRFHEPVESEIEGQARHSNGADVLLDAEIRLVPRESGN